MNARIMGSLVAAVGLAVAVAGSAHAAPAINVVNGGFETADFTGWTLVGDQTFNGVQCPGPGPTVFQGNCSAFFGPQFTTGGISQTWNNFEIGAFYNISYAFLSDGGTPNSFSATIGGVPLQTLTSLTNAPAGPYQVFSTVHRATATTETLTFLFRDDPGFLFLDAVTVQVPEPASMALLGLGLAGLGFVRRRAAK